jgi:predicted CoA-binding protein
MRRYVIFFFALAALLSAANLKLYLKDGGFQLVREYKVEGDRIIYYSVERSDWEEMPVALVDLKKTEGEASSRKEKSDKITQQLTEEDEARRELQKEILKIPQDPGVYRLDADQLQIFKLADATAHNDKRRMILKDIAPLPVVAGKSTIEIPGEHAWITLHDPRPEFFIQLSLQDSYAIVKVTPKGGVRIVERLTIAPVVNEIEEARDAVEIFSKQLTDSGLYKIWPQEALGKGEYAVVEYEEGKSNPRVWDFCIE